MPDRKSILRNVLLTTAVAVTFSGTGLIQPLEAASGKVSILRDNWGVPHVYADDTFSLFAGFGYAVAEDRLFQMEMAKRSVLGTVSEVLGIEQLPFDLQTRANFDHKKIKAQIEALGEDERNILRGYAAGYNKRLTEVLRDREKLLPKQFTDFGIEPSEWTEFDVAMIYVGTMAGRFSHNSTELNNAKLLNALVKEHGSEKGKTLFDQLLWLEDPLAPTTVPKGEGYKRADLSPSNLKSGVHQFTDLSDLPDRLEDDRPRASNLWIVGPNKTTDDSTILVNGPQFGNFNPSYVFNVGLHGAGFDITGNTPFAVPVVLFGTNGRIAWGATAGPLDVNDYYQLELNPENPRQYKVNGDWADMSKRTEAFRVKGMGDISADVFESRYGVVGAFDLKGNKAYAFKRSWDGFEIQTLMSWIKSTKAQNYDQWLDAARGVATTINWYYADASGNIGYVSPGYLPVRQTSHDVRLPAIGNGSMDWQGTRSFDAVPKTYNPSHGYIANWNNRSAKGEAATVEGGGWSSADRVVEIMARLEAKEKFSPDEVWKLNHQISFVDVNARYFVPIILQAAEDLPLNDVRAPMIDALKAWDGKQLRNQDGKATTPAVAIFRRWLAVMIKNVISDDSSAIPTTVQYHRVSLPVQLLHNALLGEKAGVPQKHDFFNGASEAQRQRIVLDALTEVREALSKEYGSQDVLSWRLELPQHVFETSNYLGIPQANKDERRAIGTSMNRGTENDMITFRSGKVEFCAVTPPGQSGFIAPSGEKSPHYEDQLSLYANFECRPQAFYRTDVEKAAVRTIDLTLE
jgi:penicillin G amidase